MCASPRDASLKRNGQGSKHMSRVSGNELDSKGKLLNGFDYDLQVWVVGGKYVDCNHPRSMKCDCYGRIHAGEGVQS